MHTSGGSLELVGPGKAQIGQWMNRSWDWFVRDAGIFILIGLVAAVFLNVGFFIIMGPVYAGLALASIKGSRQVKVEIGDFFNGFANYFLPALISGLLITLFVAIGLIFLIIPGLVISAMYMFTFHFIVDREQDFWQAMRSSRRIVASDYFGFTVFGILLGFLNILGAAFLWIGLLVSIPVTSLAITAAYLDFAGSRAVEPELLPPPVRID